jgi:rhodanese-like protein
MKKLIAALILIFVPLVAFAGEMSLPEGFGEMTPQDVLAKLKQKNVYVFDNNDQGRWKQSHLPGAKWLNPMDYDAKELPADKNATLIFYCASPH